jgi:hypothetical protein
VIGASERMKAWFKRALKMWFRLALLIAAIFVAVEGAVVIVTIIQGNVPKTPTNFWGAPFDWTTVVLNVIGGGAATGAMFSAFLVLSFWEWPRKLDRWLAGPGSSD